MLHAIIDCGTNTFNLLIVSIDRNGYRKVFKTKRAVKLGSDGLIDRVIPEKPQARAIKALKEYKAIADRYKVDNLIAVGTSALREALNANAVLRKLKAETGIKVRLISGSEEARLIYLGVRQAVQLTDQPDLIMDIGGGSTEFIICTHKNVLWKKSFRLGAARLIEQLQPADPVSKSDIRRMYELLDDELKILDEAVSEFKPVRLIGSSGSFETFAAMILRRKNIKGLKNSLNYTFSLKDYFALHQDLIKATYRERLAMPGMLRMRADMIVTATLLLSYVLKKYKLKHFELSTFALKEGLMSQLIKSQKN